jgi:hypothetical protein
MTDLMTLSRAEVEMSAEKISLLKALNLIGEYPTAQLHLCNFF